MLNNCCGTSVHLLNAFHRDPFNTGNSLRIQALGGLFPLIQESRFVKRTKSLGILKYMYSSF